MSTKAAFLREYEEKLKAAYDWTADRDKLARFMAGVRRTLTTQANTWNIDSPAVRAAWKAIGRTGAPSYKGLRALPDGEI